MKTFQEWLGLQENKYKNYPSAYDRDDLKPNFQTIKNNFNVGDKVIIKYGTFENFKGEIIIDNGPSGDDTINHGTDLGPTVLVAVSIFGRTTQVRCSAVDVEKVQ
jgi:transcription antitermination factor NusG